MIPPKPNSTFVGASCETPVIDSGSGGAPPTAWGFTSGVIEGFFGKPWGWPARFQHVEFLRDWGYQFYIYAPKADAYLRRRWREPIPSETMQHLRQLHQSCQENGIALGVGLTPFEIYLSYDTDAHEALRSKVQQINQIQPEILCMLFDDMQGGIDELAERQHRVISDICAWSNATRFIVCPTFYSSDPLLTRHFGVAPRFYLSDLGRRLDDRIDIFWTGEKVISECYSESHLIEVASEIGRKPFIWDNHIANDSKNRVNFLFLDPAAGGWSLSTNHAAGLAINGMNQPYMSQFALAGHQRLLSGVKPDPLPDICRQLCEQPLAVRVAADAHALQTIGLNGLDETARARLLERYTPEVSPYAQEIVAWLQGEYAFDPQCLTA
jgi:hyaluronoglucosaminidase